MAKRSSVGGTIEAVTAKQMLLDYVAGMTEEEALARLPLLTDAGPPPELSEEQRNQIRAALASLDAGIRTPHDEVKRRFKLT